MKSIVMWVVLTTLMVSCAATGGGRDACGPWRPILIADADRMTTETARAILAHNRAGRRLCGW